jgi:hypothetical protein
MLAHITPREAAMLKARGGSGTINPDTGLPEFDDGFDFSGLDFSLPTDVSAGVQAGIDTAATTPSPYGSLDTTPFDQSLTQPSPAAYNMALGNTFQLPSDTYAAIEAGIPLEAAPRPTTDPFATLAQRGYGDIPSNVLAYAGPTTQTTPTGKVAYEDTPEGIVAAEKEAAAELEGQPIDLTTKTPATSGFQTLFGTLGTKELIAALGLGGLGLNYLSSQNQAKKSSAALQQAYQNAQNQIQPAYAQAAQSIPAAYTQASQDLKNLVAPMQQQASTLYGQSLTGALAPAYQQQLAAAQAQAAQSYASSGGVGAAQAERSIEDLRQRLLASQQQYANSLFGVVNPTMASAIQQQLAGQVAGVQTGLQGITTGAQLGLQGTTSAQAMNLNMSQQSGAAATSMLTALAALYGGRAA